MECLTSASSIQAAYDALLAEYEVEPAQLRADLEEFIQQLLGQKLIEAGPAHRGIARAGMSGIVGILNLDGSPVDGGLLGRMTAYLGFRGPDGQRALGRNNVGFGHTLLRITEESVREAQPFTLDGRRWIVADARVDARQDLIAELRARDQQDVASDATDVELILRAYCCLG